MSQPHDFPFDITDVAELLHLRIRRPSPQGFYVDCPICNDKRGKMHINTQTDTWRCNYCDESGGMLALYAKVHSISTSAAYREISDALLNGVNLSDHAVKYPDKPKETPAEAAPVADIAVRHKTYTALLAMLTLSKEHRAHLQTVRGLPDEQIERLGYKSILLIARELDISIDAILFPNIVRGHISKTAMDFFAGKSEAEVQKYVSLCQQADKLKTDK